MIDFILIRESLTRIFNTSNVSFHSLSHYLGLHKIEAGAHYIGLWPFCGAHNLEAEVFEIWRTGLIPRILLKQLGMFTDNH